MYAKKECLFEKHLKDLKDPLKSKNLNGNPNDLSITYGYNPHGTEIGANVSKVLSFDNSFSRAKLDTDERYLSKNSGKTMEFKKFSPGSVEKQQKTSLDMSNVLPPHLEDACQDNYNYKVLPDLNSKGYGEVKTLNISMFISSGFKSLENENKVENQIANEETNKRLEISNNDVSIRAFNKELTGGFKKPSINYANTFKKIVKKSVVDYNNFKRGDVIMENNLLEQSMKSSKEQKLCFSNSKFSPLNSNTKINLFGGTPKNDIEVVNSPKKNKKNNESIQKFRPFSISGPKTLPTFSLNSKSSIKAEIDLLFGRKPEKEKEIKQDIEPEFNNRKKSTLLTKIGAALKTPINVFTKENLFEEVETEEFDNPKHRDYMEDMVLVEYVSTKDPKKHQAAKQNNHMQGPNSPKESSTNLADSLIENTMKIETKNEKPSPQKDKKKGKGKKGSENLNTNNKFLNEEISKTEVTLFAIFDGHGGYEVSSKAREVMPREIHSKINLSTPESQIKGLLIDCIEKTDKELMTKLTNCDDMGSTCTLCFITKNRTNRIIFVANLGDSHAYLVSNKKATRLTQEHKCDNEQELARLKEVNAMIFNNRLFGQLALTRALCDRKMKPHGLIATPSVSSYIVKERRINNEMEGGSSQDVKTLNSDQESDRYLILASDGIWDVTTDEDLMRIFIRENYDRSTKLLTKILLDHAVEKGSTDNISVIVIKL